MENIFKEQIDLINAGWILSKPECVGNSIRVKLMHCENGDEKQFLFTLENLKSSKMIQDILQECKEEMEN